MFDSFTEMFLGEFFLLEDLAGTLLKEERFLFHRLYECYLLPAEREEELYGLTRQQAVREIDTVKAYYRYEREKKYSAMMGEGAAADEFRDRLISIKGDAFAFTEKIKLNDTDELTESALFNKLSQSANAGVLTALRILGFLLCEGIFVGRNLPMGLKYIGRAAQWNCVEGILMALYYDGENREENVSRLYTVTRGTPYEGVAAAAAEKYGVKEVRELRENLLLNKLFGTGAANPDTYDPQFARIIFSKIMRYHEKERQIFTENKDRISDIGDFPLKLSFRNIEFDSSAFAALPVKREAEKKKIIRGIENGDLRKLSTYQPMCLCGESEYLKNMYADAIALGLKGKTHVERFEVADITEYDLEPSENNIFLRGCNEDKNNVYLLLFSGHIRETVMQRVEEFLKTEKRRKYRLHHPGVVIDLSAVLPVCLCDEENANRLRALCDVIALAPVKEAEKKALICDMISVKEKLYDVEKLEADEGAMRYLYARSLDDADELLDRVIRLNRRRGEALIVTEELLKEHNKGVGNRRGYGFGGEDE